LVEEPEVISQGATFKELQENIRDAYALVLSERKQKHSRRLSPTSKSRHICVTAGDGRVSSRGACRHAVLWAVSQTNAFVSLGPNRWPVGSSATYFKTIFSHLVGDEDNLANNMAGVHPR
jgi:predicted RNase H-like HicB family nuclease